MPTVLTQDEIKQLFKATTNIKAYAIFAVLYSTGMRISELTRLQISDLDSTKMTIHIRQGKGFKDRIVPLCEKLLKLLRQYYRSCKVKPQTYLFYGMKPDKPYSRRSVNRFLKQSAKIAGIKKNVSPHVLRHSLATHLLDNGTNIRKIQAILGHRSLNTTTIYTHLSSTFLKEIENPLDQVPQEVFR